MVSRGEHIYKNENTKQGRESYVRYDDEHHAWTFDFGQAYSTMKFHNDINDAIKDMVGCEVFGKTKIKKGPYAERIPHCWYCGNIANNHIVKTKMGKVITDIWTCNDHIE